MLACDRFNVDGIADYIKDLIAYVKAIPQAAKDAVCGVTEPPASASNRQLLPASATPRTRRQPLREASFGDAAGGLVESGQSATRRAIGRRIGATAAPCDANAAPFNDDFGDAAGEVVESKWRFLISMFSPATAVDVVNKLTASSN